MTFSLYDLMSGKQTTALMYDKIRLTGKKTNKNTRDETSFNMNDTWFKIWYKKKVFSKNGMESVLFIIPPPPDISS